MSGLFSPINAALLLLLASASGCSSASEPGPTTRSTAPAGAAAPAGDPALTAAEVAPASPTANATLPAPKGPSSATLRVLTYNVAGLPQGVSSSSPQTNMPLVSPKLNPFDLVLVQEDFTYHGALAGAATHPYKSTPMTAPNPTDLGDGLNVFSRSPFGTLVRTKWAQCSGYFDQKSDCLTSKGFARFVVDLGGGLSIDVYDAHFDAGRSDGDATARAAQVTQLVQAIEATSAGHAVIVAGDTNMKASDEATLQRLLTDAKLACACRASGCTDTERIDRVLFRSSPTAKVSVKAWRVETSFVDANGAPLSDHDPVSVDLSITN